MDTKISHRDPLLRDWLHYIHEIDENRKRIIKDGTEFCIPFMAIPTPVVKVVFTICERFQFSPNTRYVSLYLYDKFMCNHFWETYKQGVENGPDTGTWEQVSKRISSQAKLRMLSCIQIASKMDCHSRGLAISQVIAILRSIDRKHEHTPNSVYSSEFKVFKTVGFKMPMATPLDSVEILIAATGLKRTPELYEIAINILDLSYLQHQQLYSHLQFMVNGRVAKSNEEKKNFMAMEVNVLYLGASVVLCTTFFLNTKKSIADAVAAKLADIVEINQDDLWGMANVLLSMAVQIDNF